MNSCEKRGLKGRNPRIGCNDISREREREERRGTESFDIFVFYLIRVATTSDADLKPLATLNDRYVRINRPITTSSRRNFSFFLSSSLTGVVDRDLLTLDRCVGEEEGGEIRGDRLVTEIYRELRSASKVLRDRGCPRFFNNLGGYIFLDD